MDTNKTPEENPFEAMAKKFAKRTDGPSGTYLKALTQDERKVVDGFHKWLEATNFSTSGSRASYKSYLAACIVAFKEGKNRENLTSSQRSAMNKFEEYLKTLK